MAAICGGCNDHIKDQYMFHVLDKSWHEHCLCCVDCKIPQTESCFFRDGLILCRADFTRRFGTRCAGCNLVLEREDLVRRARDLVFHVRCFQCAICQKTLDTGEQLYVLGGNRFICKDDYLSSSVGSDECGSTDDLDDDCHDDDDVSNDAQSSPQFLDGRTSSNQSHHLLELDPASGNEEGKGDENSLATKRRGPRTTIKSKQLETLKAAFSATPKPTRHMREQLAAETGLNMRVIQVWFQNRRSKERRMKQTRISCGFRPSRRNRNRNEDLNGVFCDIIDPMQQPVNFGYNPGMSHTLPPPFFSQGDFAPLDTISLPNSTVDNPPTTSANRFIPRTESNAQLEALAAAVHVSSEYNLDDSLLHTLGGTGSSGLSLTAW